MLVYSNSNSLADFLTYRFAGTQVDVTELYSTFADLKVHRWKKMELGN